MDKIYVIGHKNPDTDTIVSAITAAEFLNMREQTDKYIAAISGKPNSETRFIFKKYEVELPPVLKDAKNKKLFLVDHNEASQMVDPDADVVGIFDHHKMNFSNSNPIEIVTKPWGSTNSIIYSLFKQHAIGIPKKHKHLILCALLSDTVILKSPTTTDVDRAFVNELAEELEVNYKELGMDMFKAKAQISKKTAEQILFNDFKDFDFSGKKTGIGQIETPDMAEVIARVSEIETKMQGIRKTKDYHTLILMITDILEEGSRLLIVSEETDRIADIFNTEVKNCLSGFIPGMMSRKKQVVPVLTEEL